jgi:hypothetical protein
MIKCLLSSSNKVHGKLLEIPCGDEIEVPLIYLKKRRLIGFWMD